MGQSIEMNSGEIRHEEVVEGDAETESHMSEEMRLRVDAIHQSIEQFTHMVSEMLEAGKALFTDISNIFEERLITIHKYQIEKWQEEIKELKYIDAANEEADVLLQNARGLLQNFHLTS